MYNLKEMIKIFFINIFVFFVSLSIAGAEIIKKIDIKGNNRISKDTIILFGEVQIDKDYNNNDLNLIIKNLYETDFFKDVEVELSNNVLKIKVLENPIIQKINYQGIKAKKILAYVTSEVSLKNRGPYLEFKVLEDKRKILNKLQDFGYYFAQIEVEKVDIDDQSIILNYNISMGKKAKIDTIRFVGDKKIKDRKLRNIIVSEESKPWKFISRNKYLNKEILQLDKKLLTNYYKNKGFFNVKVKSSFAELRDDERFNLVFNIDAGNKLFFNDVSLNIPDTYDSTNFDNLNKIFSKLKGEAYSINAINKILKEINKITLMDEYQFISASVIESFVGNDKIDISFNIEDTEKIYVERINIFGNNVTRERVIRDKLVISEGDGFNTLLHAKSVNNLKNTNFFKDVKSKVSDGTSDNTKIIDIMVEEKPTGEISAGAGVGTTGETIGFSVKENNFLGMGIKFASSLELSSEEIRGLFKVENPNYNYTNKSLYFSVESLERDKLTTNGYKTNKTGFTIGTGYEIYEDVRFNPAFSSYVENIKTDETASSAMQKLKGNFFDTDFDYSLVIDKRDQKFQTTDGHRTVFYQSLPIFNETDTLENSIKYDVYEQLQNEIITSLSFYAKASNSLSDEDIRLSDRNFIPASRLRGFETGKIGPKDGNDFIGGNYAASLNLKATLPTIFPNMQNADFSFFYDAANLWGVDYDSSLDKDKIRSSTGMIIDLFTPIGPLNFSFALPISKANTDETETFRFRLGTTF